MSVRSWPATAGGGSRGAVAHAFAKDVLVVAPAAPDTAPEGADGTSDTRARAYFPARVPEVLSVVDYGPDGGRPEGAPSALDPDLAAPGDAEPEAAPVHVAPSASPGIRFRTLLIAGGGLAVVLLVAAAMAVVPRGNARKWRAAG
ncbi:hypothetical protein [Streptomyces sp. NPDC046862]|uniref:hypothetical protein n=1 Tax=Streptomyces sp. NPDC046862 TaxID=3154603 RepID=UPI003455758D